VRSIGAALPKTLKSLGISRRTREAQALWLWPQLVGEHLARETHAVKLTGGTLWVTASSPALAHQLHLERSILIDRLNEAIGAPTVREIRFRQTGPSR
jgi:predicted nucleic acid-binding Zn ribbon protein